MNRVLAIAGASAKSACSIPGNLRSRNGDVLEAFKKIFPDHATKVLASIFKLSTGGARKKLDGDRAISLDEFAALLRTPHGFAYLTAIMADSEVRWWRICKPLMDVAEAQEMQIKARRKIARVMQGAIDADTDLSAARARAETLLVQDADFYSSHTDALRSMADVPDRSVAQARGRK